MKKEKAEIKDKYPWLDKDNEWRNKSDRDIRKVCQFRKKVMDNLYKYNNAFSLRGEIGTCPSIEVEIDVTDKSPFLLCHIT